MNACIVIVLLLWQHFGWQGCVNPPFCCPTGSQVTGQDPLPECKSFFDTVEHCNRANASSYVRWAIFREGTDNGVFVAQRPQPSARFISPAP